MKNILVLSDLHYDQNAVAKLRRKMIEADYVVFCGDGYDSFMTQAKEFASKIVAVRGNCDGVMQAEVKFLEVEDVKILVTHGHGHGVKSGLFSLCDACVESGASVAFFGHTHVKAEVLHNGVKMINPGAISDFMAPSYYFCTASAGKLFGKHVEL